MPAKSKAQQRYFAIAEHDPSALRGPMPNMSLAQMHDFAAGSMKGKPEHVKKSDPPKHAASHHSGRLTAADRRAIPKSQFAVPSKAPGPGSYPMPDKRHAAVAKSLAAQHASPAVKARVDAKANAMLHKGGAHPHRNLGSYLHPKGGY